MKTHSYALQRVRGRAFLNHFFIHVEWNSMRTIEEFLYIEGKFFSAQGRIQEYLEVGSQSRALGMRSSRSRKNRMGVDRYRDGSRFPLLSTQGPDNREEESAPCIQSLAHRR